MQANKHLKVCILISGQDTKHTYLLTLVAFDFPSGLEYVPRTNQVLSQIYTVQRI